MTERSEPGDAAGARGRLTLFLCGDVMLGRGVDQILPHSCPPRLHEPVITSALDYVALAERVNGPIPRRVSSGYVWGAALDALDRARPDVRIINLETAVTTSEDAAPKGINYRMHPGNAPVLAPARVDCCVLANNHVLDWGESGLAETLDVLDDAGIATAGAGRDLDAARAPAVLHVGDAGGAASPADADPAADGADRRDGPAADRARVLVFAFCATDAGIPRRWAAGPGRPGVDLLRDFSQQTVAGIARRVEAEKRPGDVAVASIHWGGNWGYEIREEHRRFAHGLIDRAGIDVVHGHSSHHRKAIEVYRDRPILYGCGDFVSDYEGISGYEEFRDDLVLMYLPTLEVASGHLVALEMVPLHLRRFRLERPSVEDRDWLRAVLGAECARFGGRVSERDGAFALEWHRAGQ